MQLQASLFVSEAQEKEDAAVLSNLADQSHTENAMIKNTREVSFITILDGRQWCNNVSVYFIEKHWNQANKAENNFNGVTEKLHHFTTTTRLSVLTEGELLHLLFV